jgi:hypothetical protein
METLSAVGLFHEQQNLNGWHGWQKSRDRATGMRKKISGFVIN